MTISDIVNDIYIKTKTNSSSYPAADMLIKINKAYNRAWSLAMSADGRWELDDSNQTDFPIATTTITTSQQDYALATSHLRIKRVEVKDTTGQWRQLDPYDNTDFEGQSITQLATQTGVPTCYDLLGNSIFLWPVPNFTQASSLKVFFERGPAEFTSGEVSTGTKVPGIASLFHALIPAWVAYEYAVDNGQPTANGFFAEIQRLEAELLKFYGSRNKDDLPTITMKPINFR